MYVCEGEFRSAFIQCIVVFDWHCRISYLCSDMAGQGLKSGRTAPLQNVCDVSSSQCLSESRACSPKIVQWAADEIAESKWRVEGTVSISRLIYNCNSVVELIYLIWWTSGGHNRPWPLPCDNSSAMDWVPQVKVIQVQQRRKGPSKLPMKFGNNMRSLWIFESDRNSGLTNMLYRNTQPQEFGRRNGRRPLTSEKNFWCASPQFEHSN